MADKVLGADYINNLLNRKRVGLVQAKKQPVAIKSFEAYDDPRGFDVLSIPQVGYPQKGDRGDIWARWIDQKRTGAAELIERMGRNVQSA